MAVLTILTTKLYKTEIDSLLTYHGPNDVVKGDTNRKYVIVEDPLWEAINKRKKEKLSELPATRAVYTVHLDN